MSYSLTQISWVESLLGAMCFICSYEMKISKMWTFYDLRVISETHFLLMWMKLQCIILMMQRWWLESLNQVVDFESGADHWCQYLISGGIFEFWLNCCAGTSPILSRLEILMQWDLLQGRLSPMLCHLTLKWFELQIRMPVIAPK